MTYADYLGSIATVRLTETEEIVVDLMIVEMGVLIEPQLEHQAADALVGEIAVVHTMVFAVEPHPILGYILGLLAWRCREFALLGVVAVIDDTVCESAVSGILALLLTKL